MGYRRSRADLATEEDYLPENTQLSPINPHGEPNITGPDGQPWPKMDFVRPWASLSEDEKKLFIRMVEVYAGFVSYTDNEIGRLLDYLWSQVSSKYHNSSSIR
jgi:arylsulfatase